MKAKITIDMSNAAFEEDWRDELSDILIRLATHVRTYQVSNLCHLRDSNGNVVGEFRVTK